MQRQIRNFKEPIDTDLESLNFGEDFKKFLAEVEKIAAEVLGEEFTDLSENFNKFFQKFVPKGRGELRKCGADSEDENEIFNGIGNVMFF